MTIRDEAVEAAAKAIYKNLGMSPWEHLGPLTQDAYRDTARHALEAAAPFIRAEALEDAADALDSDDENSFYETRRRELAFPYSKPMHSEQWGELDGIESAGKWLRTRAAEMRQGND